MTKNITEPLKLSNENRETVDSSERNLIPMFSDQNNFTPLVKVKLFVYNRVLVRK